MLDSFFATEKTYTATVKTRVQTNVNGRLGPVTWTSGKSAKCLFWRGAVAERIVGEKLRAEIEGVAIFKPSDISRADIPDSAQIDITGIGVFAAVSPDDIAEQNKVLLVPLKEFK